MQILILKIDNKCKNCFQKGFSFLIIVCLCFCVKKFNLVTNSFGADFSNDKYMPGKSVQNQPFEPVSAGIKVKYGGEEK